MQLREERNDPNDLSKNNDQVRHSKADVMQEELMYKQLLNIHMSDQLLTHEQFDKLKMLRRRRWARKDQNAAESHEPDAYTKRSIQQMWAIEQNKRKGQNSFESRQLSHIPQRLVEFLLGL